jgi:hypothetical protein
LSTVYGILQQAGAHIRVTTAPNKGTSFRMYFPKVDEAVTPHGDGEFEGFYRGTERVLLTIKSHGEGTNLQMFNRSLVANPPSGGAEWEQLLGRTHRTGQMQDEVLFDVYRHTQTFRDALDKARDLSGYIQGSFGNTQKLVAKATWRFSA